MVAAFDDLERDHISDNAHEVVEGTEDLVDHIMAGSVVHWCHWCHMVNWRDVAHWCYHDRGSDLVESSVVRSSMHLMRVHNGRSMVDHRGSMVDHRSRMVDHWGSMVHDWGSMVHHWGGMMHSRSSITRSLIINCLSSVSHFLDHPISTIMVSHSLHSSIGQCDGVRAGGGVAISGLLLLEVCPAVVVINPVLVGICRGLTQVLVGSWGSLVLRSWGSQTTADKGQQQGHLGGEGFGEASGKGGGK